MTFTSKLVSALAILPISFGFVPSANAADFCTDIAGGTACATIFDGFDIIEANIPILGGSETLQITCDGGWEYKSKGDWTEATATEFVESYCESRGINAHS